MDIPSPVDHESLISQLIAATAAARRVASIWDGVGQTVRIGFQELGAAFEEVIRAQETLAKIPESPPPPLSKVVAEYRAALGELKPHLPRFEGWLLAERARLGERREHAMAVSNWAETCGDVACNVSRGGEAARKT